MNERSRVMGNNIQLLLFQKKYSVDAFAKYMGMNMSEVEKLFDARLLLSTDEKEKVCDFLGTDRDQLYYKHSNKEYADAGCMEYRGEFSDDANKTRILDMFDYYCDLKEALEDIKEYE